MDTGHQTPPFHSLPLRTIQIPYTCLVLGRPTLQNGDPLPPPLLLWSGSLYALAFFFWKSSSSISFQSTEKSSPYCRYARVSCETARRPLHVLSKPPAPHTSHPIPLPHAYLEAVGHDLGGEPAAEEAHQAVLLDNALHGVGVRHALLVRLLVHLWPAMER